MESNIYINNVLNEGLLIHPKLNTSYVLGPFRLDPKGGVNDTHLRYSFSELMGIANPFLQYDMSNLGTVFDGRYTRVSPVGDIILEPVAGGYEIVVIRDRSADRRSGSWFWHNLGATPIFSGYLLAYVGAERG